MSQVRIHRALTQRIYLLGMTSNVDSIDFHVQGTSYNDYFVTVYTTEQPSCTCPDFEGREEACKHIFFIMYRVLGLSEDSDTEMLWDAAYQKSQASEALKGSEDEEKEKEKEKEKKKADADVQPREYIGTDCAVCFNTLTESDEISTCPKCRNSIHKACWQRWCREKKIPTCVTCRAVRV